MAAKLQIVVLMSTLLVIIATCRAQLPRYRQRNVRYLKRAGLRYRVSARQQEPVTPYPARGEENPQIPFELPTEEEAADFPIPDETYGPPDETYGPPESEPFNPQAEFTPPSNGGNGDSAAESQARISFQAQLKYRSKIAALRKKAEQLARLKARKLSKLQALAKSANQQVITHFQPIMGHRILLADGSIAYSSQLRRW